MPETAEPTTKGFDPSEPRDEHGRWSGDGVGEAFTARLNDRVAQAQATANSARQAYATATNAEYGRSGDADKAHDAGVASVPESMRAQFDGYRDSAAESLADEETGHRINPEELEDLTEQHWTDTTDELLDAEIAAAPPEHRDYIEAHRSNAENMLTIGGLEGAEKIRRRDVFAESDNGTPEVPEPVAKRETAKLNYVYRNTLANTGGYNPEADDAADVQEKAAKQAFAKVYKTTTGQTRKWMKDRKDTIIQFLVETDGAMDHADLMGFEPHGRTTKSVDTDDERRKRERDALLLLLLAAWSSEDIRRMAQVRTADLFAARNLWHSATARPWRGMLTGDGFRWDAPRQAYVNTTTRRIVPPAMTRRLIEHVTEYTSHTMEAAAESVAHGKTSAGEFRQTMADAIKRLWVVTAAAFNGGFDKLTPEVLTLTSKPEAPGIEYQYVRLNEFTQKLADLDAPAIIYRSGLYAESAHAETEDQRRYAHKVAAYNAERNVLGDAAHCEECPRLTRLGWMPIGTLPVPGTRECVFNCKCHLEYAVLPESEINPKGV